MMTHNERLIAIVSGLPLVTDFPSRTQWEAAVWQIIIERIANMNSQQLSQVLNFLISSREKKALIYRALAASRILSGIGSREIGRELWLSRATISTIKKSLTEGSYKSYRARGHVKKQYTPGPPKKKIKNKFPTVLGAVRREQRDMFRARKPAQ